MVICTIQTLLLCAYVVAYFFATYDVYSFWVGVVNSGVTFVEIFFLMMAMVCMKATTCTVLGIFNAFVVAVAVLAKLTALGFFIFLWADCASQPVCDGGTATGVPTATFLAIFFAGAVMVVIDVIIVVASYIACFSGVHDSEMTYAPVASKNGAKSV